MEQCKLCLQLSHKLRPLFQLSSSPIPNWQGTWVVSSTQPRPPLNWHRRLLVRALWASRLTVILLTSVSMFFRNLVILAIFAHGAVRTAALPLIAMTLVASYWVYRDQCRAADLNEGVTIDLGSPVSLKRVSSFAIIFLLLQVLATLGQRWIGNAGFQIVSALGGLISSASMPAAAANMAMHGHVSPRQESLWCSPRFPVL